MQNRMMTAAFVLFFACCILFLTLFYGPLRRTSALPPRVQPVLSAAEVLQLWESAGVKGRIAVLFTRHLNAERSLADEAGEKYANQAMQRGITRTLYHVVPDSAWPVVSQTLSSRRFVRATASGFILILPEGRVHVLPRSRFKPVTEQSLIVIEPDVWTSDELEQISRLVESGKQSSDLIALIRGSQQLLEKFTSLLPQSAR